MLRLRDKLIAEFIGTYAIVFFGCGSLMIKERLPEALPTAAVPSIFGVTVAWMIYSVGHISGAHFNPAVTFAFAMMRHFPKREVPFYWLAQISASVLAILLLNYLLPRGSTFGATHPVISDLPAMITELVLSFYLMFVITAFATDTRAEGTMAGVAIGGVVAICAYVGGPLTGASMNPARSLGPALLEKNLDKLWIYFLGPLMGAFLGAFVYEKIRCHSNQSNAKGCC